MTPIRKSMAIARLRVASGPGAARALVLAVLAAAGLPGALAIAADDAPGAAATHGVPEPPPEAASPAAPTSGASRGPLVVALRISQALKLSEEQTKQLSAEMRRSAQARRALYEQRSKLGSELQAQLAQKPVDEAALAATTERLAALDRQIVLLPDALWQAIRPGLSAEQGARLLLLRSELKKRARGERRGKAGRGASARSAE